MPSSTNSSATTCRAGPSRERAQASENGPAARRAGRRYSGAEAGAGRARRPLRPRRTAQARPCAIPLDEVKGHDAIWTYMSQYGPFAGAEEFSAWVKSRVALEDPYSYAIV